MFHNINRFIASRYLALMNGKHLSQYPQLVCYSFDAITGSIHLDGRFERDELDLLAKHVFQKLNQKKYMYRHWRKNRKPQPRFFAFF